MLLYYLSFTLEVNYKAFKFTYMNKKVKSKTSTISIGIVII